MGAALLPHSTSGHFVSKSVGAFLIMRLGICQGMKVEQFIKLRHHTADVFLGKITVFHRHNDIAPASAVAPLLGKQSGQCWIVIHRMFLTFLKVRERRPHLLDLSKDNFTRGGAPTQTRGRPRGTGGQPVLLRIVALGWPGPFAALVLFARSSREEVTAHPPPGSPDHTRGRSC